MDTYVEPKRRAQLRDDVNRTLQAFGFEEIPICDLHQPHPNAPKQSLYGRWFRLYRGRFTHNGAERLVWVSDAGPVYVRWSAVPENLDARLPHLTPADAPHRMTATAALLRFGPPYELCVTSTSTPTNG